MDFKAATDRLIKRTTLSDLAQACGCSQSLVERARMEGRQSRCPPTRWKQRLARLARERSAELRELAEELEGARSGLREHPMMRRASWGSGT